MELKGHRKTDSDTYSRPAGDENTARGTELRPRHRTQAVAQQLGPGRAR